MNGSQIPATIERLRALLAETRAYLTNSADGAGTAERLASIDAGLAGLTGDYGALIATYEAQIRERELHHCQVADLMPAVLTIVDANGIITHNDGAERGDAGAQPGQFVGMSVFDAFPEHGAGLDQVRRALAGESLRSLGMFGACMVETFYTPVRGVTGAVEQVIILAYDVTDRHRAEQELRTRSLLLHQVVEHAPIVLTSIDAVGVYTLIAGAAMPALGFTPGMVGQSVFAALADYPEDTERIRRALSGETVRWTGAYPRGAVDEVLTPVRDESGAVVSVVGLCIDQTERAHIDADLRAHSTLVRQVVNHVPIAVCMVDRDGVFSLVEGAAAPALGLDPGILVGRSVFEVFAAYEAELEELRRALSGETRHWTGAYLNGFAEVWLTPLRSEAGAVSGVVAMAIDISDRVRAEQRLRERDALVRQVVDHAPIILFALDPQGRITFTDGKGLALIDETPGQTVGQSIFEVRRNGVVELDAVRRALAGEAAAWVSPGPPYFDSRITPIYDDAGQVAGAIGVGVDISDRVRAEAERRDLDRRLLESQKLESLGILASGIAHDFNNLLQSILGNVESAMEEDAPGEIVRDALTRVRVLTRRGADLTRQLLAYAGKGRFAVEVLDLNTVVRRAMELLHASAPKALPLRAQLADVVLPIEEDAAQIQQILINLVRNAADALDGRGGAIVVTTGRQTVAATELADPDLVIPPPTAGDYAALTISDTGPGMDEATRARAFEPFFTTKVRGRGLGLAAIQGIVRSQGGGVRLITAPGQGTTFTVYLPMTTKPIVSSQENIPPALAPPTPEAASPARWRGSGTVLVVDDDASVCDAAARNLRRLGFTTMRASNGRAAIEVFQAHQDEITCVLLDRMMPQMDGITAARALRALNLDLCIIIMTGYNETDAAATIEDGLINSVLFKPFSIEQLRSELRRCLDPGTGNELPSKRGG